MAELDPFRTRNFVPDFERYMDDYASRSAITRATLRTQLNVAYGNAPTERLDLFFPPRQSSPAPLHIFIHGGYWRMFAKEDYSFIADTVTTAGAIAAIIDYSLMPAVRMVTIIDQVRRATMWIAANAAEFGGDATRLTISGHSAGAHLCCFLLNPQSAPISAALLLSGVYELKPLQTSFLQAEIALTDTEVARYSPLHSGLATTTRTTILVGQAETAPFHDQAQALARQLRTDPVITLPHANHMSVVLDLGTPKTPAADALVHLIREN
jgi:arylformamidase